MTTELIIAPPATGKTSTCIQRIHAVKVECPLDPIWVLVPDRQKGAYFRTRLAAEGGGMGVSIGTFRDLYHEILERAGIFVPVISQALSHRLVQEIVNEMYASGELTHFTAIMNKPGFLTALQDAFAELRGAEVRPERFLEYSRYSTPSRYELGRLYDRYISRLNALNWIDQEGQSWLAIDVMISKPNVASYLCLVVADGFTAFTSVRRHVLKLIAEQVGQLLITLPGKLDSDRQVHRHLQDVIEPLRLDLSPVVAEIGASPHFPPDILHLEQHALDPGEFEKMDPPKPIMLEARSQFEETREALRWIKELNIRQHIPLDACAVFAGNLDNYQPLLRAAANEFGIKIQFTQPDPLAESPAVLALLTLLNLPLEDFPTRTLFNTLHSPYFDFHLTAKEIENLEKVSQQAIIVAGKEQWDDAWMMLGRSRASAMEQPDDERQRKDLTAGIDLLVLCEKLKHFWELFVEIDQDRSQAEWVEWLENLMGKVAFNRRILTERDRDACLSLGEALKALVISESVLGIRRVNYAQFLSDLNGTLSGSRVKEPLESRRNALLAGRIVEARGSRFQAVALLGLSEGLFPVVENPDPFLDENLRKDLGLEPRLQREQGSIFYQAFTRADAHLLLTRPYLVEDGEPWEASPFWLSAKNLFTDHAVQRVKPGMTRTQADAASAQELLFWATQQQDLHYPEDAELHARWQTLAKARTILDSRRAKKPKGIFEGDVKQVASHLATHYSTDYEWSASRLEEYGSCPYKFFINSTLKLVEKTIPEPGLDAAQVGSIYHRILEMVYTQAIEKDVRPREILDEIAARAFENAPKEFDFRPSPLWEVEKAQYLETLRQTLEALEEERKEWTPVGFERKFGLNGNPPLTLEIEGETIHLHGVIDRIDMNSRGEIRVIDYKTGSTHLEKADLKSGIRLQLPIYALAAEMALHLGRVVDGFYWKINAAKASAFKLSSFNTDDAEGPQAAYAVAMDHIRNNVSKIQAGEFPSQTPKGGCPEYCPATQWCWHYLAGYKND